MARHGSRAPKHQHKINATQVWYPEGVAQLTPMGERQHYLIGSELRKRYAKDQEFLASSLDPQEVHVYSTNVNRTYQSAISQAAGLYPPGTGPVLSEAQQRVAIPPIFVTNMAQIQASIGDKALPNGYQLVPIHSNAGNPRDLLFRAYDPDVCPVVGYL